MHNIGFSAMLAEEYVLIVPFATHLQSGLNEYNSTTEYNINCNNFTQQQSGLKDHIYQHNLSRQKREQKALDVVPYSRVNRNFNA